MNHVLLVIACSAEVLIDGKHFFARVTSRRNVTEAVTVIAQFFCLLFANRTRRVVGMWEAHSAFQGPGEGWKTCSWFSRLSRVRHFHSCVSILELLLLD